VRCADKKKLADFEQKNQTALATASERFLTYLAQSDWMLLFFIEKLQDIEFHKTRENI
jgi:peptide chain release factor 3